ncbi:band 4.1-like protein 4B [Pelodytes ibericus]
MVIDPHGGEEPLGHFWLPSRFCTRVGHHLIGWAAFCDIWSPESRPLFAMKEETTPSDFSKSPSLQEANVRSPASIRAESTQSTGSSSSKQEVRPPRLKKLTRQFSFNHSDEDDLPPALAAVVAESDAEHRAALMQASNGHSHSSSIEKSPSKASSSFTLEPGDLLMDFTEATPMIKTYPADPCNSFFDPFTTVTQFPVDLLETPLQQYSAAHGSPKRLSPSMPMRSATRQLVNQAQTMQTSQSSHISAVDSQGQVDQERFQLQLPEEFLSIQRKTHSVKMVIKHSSAFCEVSSSMLPWELFSLFYGSSQHERNES